MKTLIKFSIAVLICSMVSLAQQWVQLTGIPQGAGITDMIVLSNGHIIATTASFNWPNGQPGGIRRSTDDGITWQYINSVYNARTLWLGTTGKIFASYWPYPQNESMFYSTDNGSNWTQMYFGNANDNVFSVASKDNDNMVFIGTRFGVKRSINNSSWESVNNGIPSNTFVYDMDIDASGTYIAAGTSKGLYISSNNGNNWNAVSGISTGDTIYTVQFANSLTDAAGDNILFTGSSAGKVFQSSEGAQYLTAILVVTFFGKIGDIEVVTNNVFTNICAVLSPLQADNLIGPGFTLSTNFGQNWNEINNGLPANPNLSCITFRFSGNIVNYFAGLFDNSLNGAKVYKMSVPIGIQPISNKIPESFSLSQNYPNPFNPSTKIRFSITASSFVNLKVFDLLGRDVSVLVNEKLNAGTYETDWNANNISSGVYFYKLQTGDYIETKKMILVK